MASIARLAYRPLTNADIGQHGRAVPGEDEGVAIQVGRIQSVHVGEAAHEGGGIDGPTGQQHRQHRAQHGQQAETGSPVPQSRRRRPAGVESRSWLPTRAHANPGRLHAAAWGWCNRTATVLPVPTARGPGWIRLQFGLRPPAPAGIRAALRLSGACRGGAHRPRLGVDQDFAALVALRWSSERMVVRLTTATTPGTPCARSAAASTDAGSATEPRRYTVRPSTTVSMPSGVLPPSETAFSTRSSSSASARVRPLVSTA